MSDDDLLLAAFCRENEDDSREAARPITTDCPIGPTPLVTLVNEIARRRDAASFHFAQKSAPRPPGNVGA